MLIGSLMHLLSLGRASAAPLEPSYDSEGARSEWNVEESRVQLDASAETCAGDNQIRLEGTSLQSRSTRDVGPPPPQHLRESSVIYQGHV